MFVNNLSILLDSFTKDFSSIADNKVCLFIVLFYLFYSAYMDTKFYRIPQKISLLLFSIRLFLIPLLGLDLKYVLGAIIPFFMFWVIAAFLNQNMGGDIKFIGAIGIWLGINVMFFLILITSFLVLLLLILKNILKIEKVPIAYAKYFSITFCLIYFIMR